MDAFYIFATLGFVAVFLILHFDKQQRRRVKETLIQTSDVEPLLMLQSMGQKIERLNKALIQIESPQYIEQQLRKSTADYKAGQISINAYNRNLNELLSRVEVRR